MKRKSIVKVLSICLALSIIAAIANDALIIKAETGNIPSLQYDIQMQDYATPQGVAFSSSDNRASAVAAYETGGRDFAYVGSSNGFTIFDITDPSEISIVQEISGDIIKTAISSKGVLVKDGRLIVANTKTNKIEFYQIATDGKIGSPYKSIDGTSMSRLEILDNYLFIAQNSNKGVEVYDLSNIADGESIVYLGNRASSVQAHNFTVAKISQNQYRIFLIDRVSTDVRQFVIFDVDMTGGGFAFTELYNKVPTEFTFPNPSQTQVFYLGDNVLVLGCGTVNDNGKDQIMVDVSNPGQPTEITTYSGRVQTYKYLGDGHYLAGTPDKSLGIYAFADGARAQIGETYAISGGQVYEVTEHKGNLLIANSSQFSVWSYKTEIDIESESLIEGMGNNVGGIVYGYNSNTDTVKISVNDGDEVAVSVEDNRFFFEVEGNDKICATLYRNNMAYVAACKVISIVPFEGNESDFNFALQKISATAEGMFSSSTNRAVSVAATTFEGADYAYVASSDGFKIFNITDPSNILNVAQFTSEKIKVEIRKDSVAVKDGYVILSNRASGNYYIEIYKIQSGGLIDPNNPYYSISSQYCHALSVFGDYLYIAGQNGIQIYDLTNISDSSSIKLAANLESDVQARSFDVEVFEGAHMVYYVDRGANNSYNIAVASVSFEKDNVEATKISTQDIADFTNSGPSSAFIESVNENEIILYNDTGTAGSRFVKIDVSNPNELQTVFTDTIRTQDVYKIDENYFAIATPEKVLALYDNTQQTPIRIGDNHSTAGQGYQLLEHKGNLLIANSAEFSVWQLKRELKITSASVLSGENPTVKGLVYNAKAGDVLSAQYKGEQPQLLTLLPDGSFEYLIPEKMQDGEKAAITVTLQGEDGVLTASQLFVYTESAQPYEIEEVVMRSGGEQVYELQNGDIDLDITLRRLNFESNAKVQIIAALYENDALKEVKTTDADFNFYNKTVKTVTLNIDNAQTQTIKVFVWDGLGTNIQPMANRWIPPQQQEAGVYVNFNKGSHYPSPTEHFGETWEWEPVITRVSDDVSPGETFLIYGEGFTQSSVVYVQQANAHTPPEFSENDCISTQIIEVDEQGQCIISRAPEQLKARAFNLWVKNEHGVSAPVGLNTARPQWLSFDVASPGAQISVYGKNFMARHYKGALASGIALVSGENVYDIPIASVNPYEITGVLPADVPNGVYNVFVTNDGVVWNLPEEMPTVKVVSGSDPYQLGVAWAGEFNWENVIDVSAAPYNVSGSLQQQCSAVLQQAINDAGQTGGGVVYLPLGIYHADGLTLPENVVLMGDGMYQTIIKHTGSGATFVTSASNSIGRSGLLNIGFELLENIPTPDVYLKLGSGSQDSVKDMNKRAFQYGFLKNVRLETKMSRSETDARGIGLLMNGRSHFLVDGCEFKGYLASITSSYVSEFCTITNNTFDTMFGNLVVVTGFGVFKGNTIRRHSTSENTYDDSSQGVFTRGPSYLAYNQIYTTGSEGLNDGEILCVENYRGGVKIAGAVCEVEGNTITVDAKQSGVADWQLDVAAFSGNSFVVSNGRGLGQYARIIDFDEELKTITLDKAFAVPPNSSSRFIVMPLIENVVYYKNYAENAEKGYWMYCDTVDSVIDDNVGIYTEGAAVRSIYKEQENSDDYRQAIAYYSVMKNNKFEGESRKSRAVGVGIYCAIEGTQPENYYTYGAEIKANTIIAGEQTGEATGRSEAPHINGVYIIYNVRTRQTELKKVMKGIIIENNYMKNTDRGITIGHQGYPNSSENISKWALGDMTTVVFLGENSFYDVSVPIIDTRDYSYGL
ncbi:MAG: hypothetical protein M0R40_07025 [Firmicutes bacterium]|nr:hypothetical protein [Bacillota bacterium]